MKTYKDFISEAKKNKDNEPYSSAKNIPPKLGRELMRSLANNEPNAAANLLAAFKKNNPKHSKTAWLSGPIRPSYETEHIFK